MNLYKVTATFLVASTDPAKAQTILEGNVCFDSFIWSKIHSATYAVQREPVQTNVGKKRQGIKWGE